MDEPIGDRLMRSRPLAELVYERLEERIIDGTFAPGQHLREEELAQRMGVSRNPIRESLRALERAGWLEIHPGRGAFVRAPSVSEVLDFFHVRTLLEVESARLAARNATARDVSRLEQILQQGQRALGEEQADTLVELNSRFHSTVHNLANNTVLREALTRLDRRLRWYFTTVVTERAPLSWDEHRQLVSAFADNDEDRAAAIMRAHVESTAEAYRISRQASSDE